MLWFLILICGLIAVVFFHSFFLACLAIIVGIVLTVVHKEFGS